MATIVVSFMNKHGILWERKVSYAAIANGRGERMIGALKNAKKKTVLESQSSWDNAISGLLYGYQRRSFRGGRSPVTDFYGILPRLNNDEATPLLLATNEIHREKEIDTLILRRFNRIDNESQLKTRTMRIITFKVGDVVLARKCKGINPARKWPAITSEYFGACRMTSASHPRYELKSIHGRVKRQTVHAGRLKLFHQRSMMLEHWERTLVCIKQLLIEDS